MHAIIETGGKQYKVTEGDTLFIEKLEAEAGQAITFDKVLAILDGDKATFGAPVVEGASVAATVVKNGKGKKVRIFKYNPSGYAEAGADIVCAAVTSAVRLAECAVNDVLGLEAAVKVRQKDAYLSLKLPAKLGQTAESTCQTLMTALMVHFAQLHEEYPDHIIVLEV